MKDVNMISTLKRRIERFEKMVEEKLQKEQGNEINFTYWGGFNLGYLKGKITVLEEFLDYLELDN